MSYLSGVTNSLIYSQISNEEPFIYPEIAEGVQNQFTNVLLIDRQVPDYQVFVDSVNSSTFPIVYSTMSSKTELLTLLQKMFTSISRIGIAFTSELGNVKMFLDNKNPLFKEEETVPFSENVQFIIDIIKEFSVTNIDYLACNTLKYTNWTNYYNLLTLNTSVVVGASSDKTGNIKYGGDWTMESTGQDIELIYFTQSIEYYTFLLDSVTATITVGPGPRYMVLNSSGTRLYVANTYTTTGSVSVINTSNNTLVTTITVSNHPDYMVINNSANILYVGCYFAQSIVVVNTVTNTVVTTITNIPSPGFMVLNLSTNRLYYSDFGYIFVINTVTNTFDSGFATGDQPWYIVIDSSRSRLYVANYSDSTVGSGTVSIIDTTTNEKVVSDISVGGNPYYMVMNSSGSLLYVANDNSSTIGVINITTNTFVTNITVGTNPKECVLNSTGTRLYVANYTSNTVSVINTANNTVIQTIVGVGGNPQSMSLNSSTNCLYVASYNGNTVYVIDITTNTVSETITVGSNATFTLLNSSANLLYVTNRDSNNVSVITTTLSFVCFNKHTKILTVKGYIPIQDLRKGDMVKTLKHGYKAINIICKSVIHHPASKERIKDQLYKCSKDNFDEIFEPLIITGSHSILVDDFTSNEQREKTNKVLGDIFITDDKYRLPACADERTTVYEIPGNYTVYHMALENDDYYENYGIFANGLLVETCSKRYLKELSNMTLIQ